MHLVDRNRLAQPVALGARAVIHCRIAPFVADPVSHTTEPVFGRSSAQNRIRVGLQERQRAAAASESQTCKSRPRPAPAEIAPTRPIAPQRRIGLHAPVPAIEIADHAHAQRIRRPHREMHAANAFHFAHVRAQLFVAS